MKKVKYQFTNVNYEGKAKIFLVTLVLIVEALYFTNDQKEIKANNRKFGIKPEKPEGDQAGIVYSRFDGNTIITFSIPFGKKVVYVQFLSKETLIQEHLIPFLSNPLNNRYMSFKDALINSIGLNQEDVERRKLKKKKK